MFLIYINNLPNIDISGAIYLFADDSAIFFEDLNWNILADKVTRDLSLMKKWFDQNCLTLNVSKTKFMPISLRDPGEVVNEIKLHTCGNTRNANCNCKVIEKVNSYKYLGVIFDSKLTWKEHIIFINNKLRKLIYAFKQLGEILTLKDIRKTYCAYVQSIIEGGIIIWGGTFKTNLQSLMVTQKSILKASLQKPRRYPSDNIFQEFEVFDVRQIFVRTLTNYIHKHSEFIFQNSEHTHQSRTAQNCGIHMPRLQRTFSTTCPYIISHYVFQKMPRELRQFHLFSQANYKIKIKTWLKELGRDNVEQLIAPMYRS